jgi:hypothetical protein
MPKLESLVYDDGPVLRGFYGHFFQPAPIKTVSISVLEYAGSLPGGENTFAPLPSERDEEHQFGIEIPWKGWLLGVDTFKNHHEPPGKMSD